MTEAQLQERYFSWVRKHYGARKCEFCDYRHDGFHDYHTHLSQQHPEKFKEWQEWTGIKE